MSRRLPNLNQLRAFEAAARHLSFKKAAEELHVTHAAVSHQIKALEEDLGRPLFRRLPRKVELEAGAAEFALRLGASFDQIEEAASSIRDTKQSGRIRMSAVPAFGYRFVLPRLARFREAHPDIEVEIELQAGIVSLEDGEFDAALRYGGGAWAGLDKMLIFRDILAVVASPTLIAGRALPLAPVEIAGMPYAVSTGAGRDWRSWCAGQGLESPERPAPLPLDNRAVVLDFLLAGGGVALTDLRFAANELASGQLVQLHPDTVEGTNGTYLVWPKTRVVDPKLTAFGAWLRSEVAAMDTVRDGA